MVTNSTPEGSESVLSKSSWVDLCDWKASADVEFIDLKTQYALLKDSIDARIRAVLGHGHFIMGPEVAELEQRLAARTGSHHCVACSSGTDALLIALMALGVGQGDEVVTTPFTFVATVEDHCIAWRQAGICGYRSAHL